MTFLLSLMTMFLDAEPFVPAPPSVGIVAQVAELENAEAVEASFNLPKLTPTHWQGSPSWMVAVPPGPKKPFDPFSPGMRPAQQFPSLLPCPTVALVPCPLPDGEEEAPAVRHVDYQEDGFELELASNDVNEPADCPNYACPVSQSCQTGWKPPQFSTIPNPDGMTFSLPRYAPHPLLAPFGIHPPIAVASACPAEPVCPVAAGAPGPYSSFPGAKSVVHTVSATYDVSEDKAKALKSVLENGEGVLSCEINGNELTITAHPRTQSAIAHFLTTTDLISHGSRADAPAKVIDVKHSKTKTCCDGKCSCKKGECQCCCCKKNEKTASSDGWWQKYVLSEKARQIERNVGITDEDPVAAVKKCAAEKCTPVLSCPTPAKTQAVVHTEKSFAKPVQIRITATSGGVEVQTSNGSKIKAQEIRLETNSVGKLEIDHGIGRGLFQLPQPTAAPSNPLPTY